MCNSAAAAPCLWVSPFPTKISALTLVWGGGIHVLGRNRRAFAAVSLWEGTVLMPAVGGGGIWISLRGGQASSSNAGGLGHFFS